MEAPKPNTIDYNCKRVDRFSGFRRTIQVAFHPLSFLDNPSSPTGLLTDMNLRRTRQANVIVVL